MYGSSNGNSEGSNFTDWEIQIFFFGKVTLEDWLNSNGNRKIEIWMIIKLAVTIVDGLTHVWYEGIQIAHWAKRLTTLLSCGPNNILGWEKLLLVQASWISQSPQPKRKLLMGLFKPKFAPRDNVFGIYLALNTL